MSRIRSPNVLGVRVENSVKSAYSNKDIDFGAIRKKRSKTAYALGRSVFRNNFSQQRWDDEYASLTVLEEKFRFINSLKAALIDGAVEAIDVEFNSGRVERERAYSFLTEFADRFASTVCKLQEKEIVEITMAIAKKSGVAIEATIPNWFAHFVNILEVGHNIPIYALNAINRARFGYKDVPCR